MAIDQSLLTIMILIISLAIGGSISYKKEHSIFYTIKVLAWVIALYCVFSCCILPIQFTKTGSNMAAFADQFSIMTINQFKLYMFDYALSNLHYFICGLLFVFSTCILFTKFQKGFFRIIVILIVPVIHIIYNVTLNTILNEIVKFINFEDILLIICGSVVGFIFALITNKAIMKDENINKGFPI